MWGLWRYERSMHWLRLVFFVDLCNLETYRDLNVYENAYVFLVLYS